MRLWGEEIAVRATVHTINGFSAHADQQEPVAWQQQTGWPKVRFLVHGEAPSMQQLATQLTNTHIEMPTLHETFDL